jgi:CRP/FNR family transcriptional regulator, cyclic AMP receptor protein
VSAEDPEAFEPVPLRWPRAPRTAPRQQGSTSLYAYLLDVDDDLAEEFDVRARVSARQLATARVLEADVGEHQLTDWFETARNGLGLLVLDGLVAFELRVGDRTATELLGAGDLLEPPIYRSEELLEPISCWRVLSPLRLALLDAEFTDRVRPWPQIVQTLLRRAARRISDVDALRAITAQPRLEVRLDLLLWHLAARWGRVEPAGLRLTLPLTHRLLGQLVSAERPSISHALGRLDDAGLVTGSPGDWHLHGSLESHLESLIERPAQVTPRPRGRPRSPDPAQRIA